MPSFCFLGYLLNEKHLININNNILNIINNNINFFLREIVLANRLESLKFLKAKIRLNLNTQVFFSLENFSRRLCLGFLHF